jgi:hypothetical protein
VLKKFSVVAVAFPTHTGREAELDEPVLVQQNAVLRGLVGVMNEPRPDASLGTAMARASSIRC